jgi:hypothetical protein
MPVTKACKLEQESYAPIGADEDTRKSDPIVAEAMGYAMKPGIEDAQQLDAMKDEALAEYKGGQGFVGVRWRKLGQGSGKAYTADYRPYRRAARRRPLLATFPARRALLGTLPLATIAAGPASAESRLVVSA